VTELTLVLTITPMKIFAVIALLFGLERVMEHSRLLLRQHGSWSAFWYLLLTLGDVVWIIVAVPVLWKGL
jgi:hypothetical protein